MVVRDIMTTGAITIEADCSITQAAQKLKGHGIGLLPVVEGHQLIGAISDRDIVIRAIAQQLDPQHCKVREIMTPHVAVCFEDQEIEEAAHLMKQQQIRRLLVLNKDQHLVGMLSLGDFAIRGIPKETVEEVLHGVSERLAHAP